MITFIYLVKLDNKISEINFAINQINKIIVFQFIV